MPSKSEKVDKDMGREVKKLGGFRPSSNRLTTGSPTKGPVTVSRQVEILIVSPGRAAPSPAPKRPWWNRPLISVKKAG